MDNDDVIPSYRLCYIAIAVVKELLHLSSIIIITLLLQLILNCQYHFNNSHEFQMTSTTNLCCLEDDLIDPQMLLLTIEHKMF